MTQCVVDGCERERQRREWCKACYERQRLAGVIEVDRRPSLERLWARIKRTRTCWLWQGAISSGYGRVRWDGRDQAVHRVVYELLVGPIPAGLELDHLCRNRPCCNPRHLEPVTGRVNKLRGESPAAKYAVRETCSKGHPYEGDNYYVRDGIRVCRVCRRAAAIASYQRRRVPKPPKTHCPSGHPYAGENLVIGKKGERICRECGRTRAREHARKKRAMLRARNG